ncbi:TPA: hypothetical protein ACF2DD_002059 [Clostridium perfringens]
MEIKYIESRNESIIENAKLWAKGEECLSLEPLDILILGEVLNIKIPTCFHHFIRSESPTRVRASGAFKTIYKVLEKIQNKLLLME